MSDILDYALTTVADVKESLGIASSDSSWDNLIKRKINQATRQIEAYCGRRFKLSTYTQEIYNASNTDQLILRQRPIVGTPTLEVRDSSLNDSSFESIDSQFFFIDANSGILNMDFRGIGSWGRYRVTYQAGYTTIPEDLAEACVSLVCYYVNNADGRDIGVSVKKEGQRELRYANGNLTFTSITQNLGIDGIIDSYANFPVMTDR